MMSFRNSTNQLRWRVFWTPRADCDGELFRHRCMVSFLKSKSHALNGPTPFSHGSPQFRHNYNCQAGLQAHIYNSVHRWLHDASCLCLADLNDFFDFGLMQPMPPLMQPMPPCRGILYRSSGQSCDCEWRRGWWQWKWRWRCQCKGCKCVILPLSRVDAADAVLYYMQLELFFLYICICSSAT